MIESKRTAIQLGGRFSLGMNNCQLWNQVDDDVFLKI